MFESIVFSVFSALWLGILTSISPCPMGTNIAAISFIGKSLKSPRHVLLAGLLYTSGRAVTYLALAAVIIAGLLSMPEISVFLQNHMNRILGPILILVGVFLLELLSFNFKGFGVSKCFQDRIEKQGVWGSFFLGIVFALSLCPISAALFFGSLIPLSIQYNSIVALPSVYGIGTAIPVIAFAFLIAFSAHSVSRAFNRLNQVERWARRITGVVFMLAGTYYCIVYIFGVL